MEISYKGKNYIQLRHATVTDAKRKISGWKSKVATQTMFWVRFIDTQMEMPYISTPTRITDSSATLIDHIFVKFGGDHRASNITAGNLLTDISDHLPSFLKWSNHPFVSKKPRPFIRLYSEQNEDNFKQALEGTEWNQLLNNGDVDICNEDYYNHINELLNIHFPTVRLSRKRSKY